MKSVSQATDYKILKLSNVCILKIDPITKNIREKKISYTRANRKYEDYILKKKFREKQTHMGTVKNGN